jgi:hypothetical protein
VASSTYDANGRVSHQEQADGSDFDFAYTLSGSTVTQGGKLGPRVDPGDVTSISLDARRYAYELHEPD